MSNERNGLPFKIVEQKIPFLERVSNAVQVVIWAIAACVTTLILLPVNFLRVLFTTKRNVLEITGQQVQGGNIMPLGGINPFGANPDDDEDWKRAHREEYGD